MIDTLLTESSALLIERFFSPFLKVINARM